MKLTKQKLKHLVLEQLSDYESEYFGKPEKPFSIQDPDPEWIESNIGQQIGSGYSRLVFDLGNDYVIKIPYGSDKQSGADTNLIEAKLFNQYPMLFPKAFAHHPQGDWLIVEKLEIIKTNRDFKKVLMFNFPAFKKMVQIMVQDPHGSSRFGTKVDDLWFALQDALHWDADRPLGIFKSTLNLSVYSDTTVMQCWRTLTKDETKPDHRNLYNWSRQCADLKIDLRDISTGNVGWTKGGRFVILDISIFENMKGLADNIRSNPDDYKPWSPR